MSETPVTYVIQERSTCWAVLRNGPRGGQKFIAAYRKELKEAAEGVCAALNRWAGQEK